MMKSNPMRVIAAAVALALAGTANAQQPDTTTLAKPAVDAASCADLSFQKEILARYPNIAAACQEVVISNDRRFARFAGELEQVRRDGSITVDFKDREGRSLGRATTLQPAPTQRALIEGRSYRFSELVPGQKLNMYVPEASLVVATEPNAPPEAMAKMVLDEPAATETPTSEPVRLADAAEPQPAMAQSDRLPDTAGWTPMLALAGLIALMGGLFLRTTRRLRGRNAL